ncbi:MAG: hypothetical protein ACK57J_04650 [Rubrivivax sp.]
MVGANLLAQQLPLNPSFLVADPMQTWRLAAMWWLPPQELIVVPLLLWAVGSALWFKALRLRRALAALGVLVLASGGAHLLLPQALGIPSLAVSEYKGVSCARKFPDSQRPLLDHSPFGQLEVQASSYLHFAPGLSDNAAFNLPSLPENAYLGLYIDGDGPIGLIRQLEGEQAASFRFRPPDHTVVLWGRLTDPPGMLSHGGINESTHEAALPVGSGTEAVDVGGGRLRPSVAER